MKELVAIAKIAKTMGLRGELAADILTDFPERFKGLKDVTAVLPNEKRLDLKIENFRFQSGRIVIKFANYDSIETAEALRNAEICVAETDVVKLEPDEYFDWELTNCEVVTIGGQKIGKVRELMRTGGTEILVVTDETKEFLIPFADAICVEVDVEKKLIRVDPPKALLEF